jgi:hypothetical protein
MLKESNMRPVSVKRLNCKILIEYLENATACDLQVKSFLPNEVIFEEPCSEGDLLQVKAIAVSFQIAKKWKTYNIVNFEVRADTKDSLVFELENEDDRRNFARDFSLVRIGYVS